MSRINPNIYIGLNKEQVNDRIKNKLVNYDTSIPTKSYKKIIYENIFTLFNVINLCLGVLIVFTGTYKNLTFLGVAFINTFISMFQEIRAKKVIDELAVIASTKASVKRDGKDIYININEIVLDDIIKYKLGNQVVVDSVIKDGFVEVDESFITGESDSILKQKGDLLLSGSFIVSGECIAQVDSVGEENYTNKISKEAKYIKKISSEIMITLKKIIKFISITIIPIGIILFLNQMRLNNNEINESIISVVAALIGMIPEGLVLLVSTVLAISSVRLAKQKVLVQDLYCIENLARVDTICLDKTGTLTNGEMNVVKVVNLTDNIDLTQIMNNISYNMNNDNATSRAIKEYFKETKNWKLINKINFSSKKKCSVYEFFDNTYVVGALEFINYIGKIDISEYNDYRVLLVASSKDKIKNNEIDSVFKPIGLIILSDEIRKNVKETLDYLVSQDVSIKIISGDNVLTVSKIAKKVGLEDIRPFDMSTVSEDTNLLEIVDKYNIFGRVTPSGKKDLVIALKAKGHKVAMTGDGVNDVLSLREADCSIAMASGSDATRNVSEIVLLDSDFKAIPSIIKEGRRTINNLERSASLFLTKTIYATILAILFVFIKMDYPFIPIQLTLNSVLTIGIPSFILALEPNHNRVKGSFIINVISKSIPAALTIVVNIITIMFISSMLNFSESYISTMSVILVVFTGFVLLFKVCYPFNLLRRVLYISLAVIFIVSGITLHNLFELVLLTPIQFIIILLLCIVDIGIFNALTELCEKKIFKYKERILK